MSLCGPAMSWRLIWGVTLPSLITAGLDSRRRPWPWAEEQVSTEVNEWWNDLEKFFKSNPKLWLRERRFRLQGLTNTTTSSPGLTACWRFLGDSGVLAESEETAMKRHVFPNNEVHSRTAVFTAQQSTTGQNPSPSLRTIVSHLGRPFCLQLSKCSLAHLSFGGSF